MKKRIFRRILPFIGSIAIWWVGAIVCACAESFVFRGQTLPTLNSGYLLQILCAILFLAGVVGYYGFKITTLLKEIRDGKKGDDPDDKDDSNR